MLSASRKGDVNTKTSPGATGANFFGGREIAQEGGEILPKVSPKL